MTRVPFVDLARQDEAVVGEVLAAVSAIVREARFVLGPRVEAFELWLAQSCGTAHAVTVASGSDALELTLRALGVGAGDAVITPALSFVAAAEAIAITGARPLFCDVDRETMNLSESTVRDALERAATQRLRVRAIVPVHLFGRPAPIAGLRRLAARGLASAASVASDASAEELVILEDAAQALGARDEAGRPVGGIGDAGCFSFFPTKNLGAWGDGGAVVTDRADVAARVRRLRAHGATAPYVHAELGRNSRLDALQAAILLAKSRHLPMWQAARTRLARRYREELSGLPLTLPGEPDEPAVHAWHAFVVRCDRRDALANALRERDIETRVYYPVPLHRQACFEGLCEPPLCVSEEICRTALALPLFTAMREDEQGRVIDEVRAFFRR